MSVLINIQHQGRFQHHERNKLPDKQLISHCSEHEHSILAVCSEKHAKPDSLPEHRNSTKQNHIHTNTTFNQQFPSLLFGHLITGFG